MALDVTINLTDAQDAELVKLTNESNAFIIDPTKKLTPSQWLRRDVRERLDLSAQQRADGERYRFRARFNQATPEEQATIDAILSKYPAT
jgi:uncharacterized protein YecA (UPF0149 family)